jgi:hypothetical protein
MRCAIALLFLTLPAGAADLRIDHVTVAGGRLEEMRKAFTGATDIPTEYGDRTRTM